MAGPNAPLVSVIILTRNRRLLLEKHLGALLQTLDPSMFELIVVDNASVDGSRDALNRLAESYPGLKLVLNPVNRGVAGGRNDGLRVAQGEYLVLLDDDTSMRPEVLRAVPSLFAARERCGLLAFKVLNPISGDWVNDHGTVARPVANFAGAAHALKREVLMRVGEFDELCTFGAEELDFSIRAHAAGYGTIYLPDMVAEHHSRPQPGGNDSLRAENWTYNFVRVLFKHFPRPMATLYGARFLIGVVIHECSRVGPWLAARLVNTAVRGRIDGIRVHRLVRPETVEFYRDTSLRPDFGNIPFSAKIRDRLRTRRAGRK
ncbi:glycosyltransferase [candidate division WOR-3 bacterium]|uniref:Glycosyltransferase n=1 Tax=candidate division WOR-3 bacterium TaxID=2052148 RepID=A0A938BRB3_UNCW3|nr:glycosyltransferase [candidate division WOR-3 bacterium]